MSPVRIALFYALFAAMWIFCSDSLLMLVVDKSVVNLTRLQMVKGGLFILATAGIIFVLLAQAMSLLRESQESLAGNIAHYRKLFERGPIPMALYDVETMVYLAVNDAVLHRFGYQRQELVGQNILTLFLPEDRDRVRSAVARQGDGYADAGEWRLVTKTGDMLHAHLSYHTMEIKGRRTRLVVARETTQQRQAEAENHRLQESLENRVRDRTADLREANELLGAFGYLVSQDLIGPIRSIRQFASELITGQSAHLTEDGLTLTRRIVGATARIESDINDLLEFCSSDRARLPLENVSLILLIMETLGQLEREFPFVRQQISVIEPLHPVVGHRPVLRRVLGILLRKMLLNCPDCRTMLIHIWAEMNEPNVRLCIEDQSMHLTAEQCATFFDTAPADGSARESTHRNGRMVARHGIERLGGTISAHPGPNGGTTFHVELQAGMGETKRET